MHTKSDGAETNYLGGERQGDWPEGRQRLRKLPPYKVFKVPKGTDSLSESPGASFHMYSFFLFSLPPASWLNSFLTGQARTEDLGPSHLPL